MNIDHHIQQTILERLAASESVVRYSDLKDGDIENSLFSYHLNKLIDRHMVEKRDDGYRLSVDGARWLNDNGFSLKQQNMPRVYVALVVQNSQGRYLIGQRTGQLKDAINDYLLPSKVYTNDQDLPYQVEATKSIFIPSMSINKQVDCGFVQIRPTYNDGKTMRVLLHITYCQTDYFESNNENFAWMSREQIAAIDHPSGVVLQKMIEYAEDTNRRTVTPVIFG